MSTIEHDVAVDLDPVGWDGTGEPDPDTGRLFEVPRVAVTVDDTDPGVLKVAFSGQVELNRSNPDDVAFYNSLKAGRDCHLHVDAFCAGPRNSHRRDSEGNVDAVVQTKSLVVHSCAGQLVSTIATEPA